MTKVLVISDMHFGHRNICKYRDAKSPESHDFAIYHNILSVLRKRDILWILGDCFFTEDSIKYAKAISQHCSQLNWVLGNHDTDNAERQKVMREIISAGYVNKVGGLFKYKEAWLSHSPIHPCELRGRFNIHGHTHKFNVPDPRYFNASCENVDFKPKNMQEIFDELKRKNSL